MRPVGLHISNTASARAGAALGLAVVWMTLTGLLGPLPRADAHDELTRSDPAADSQLQTAPAQIQLTFTDEPVAKYSNAVLTIDGGKPTTLPTRVDGVVLTAEVNAPMPSGKNWSLAYRVVSSDGHPVTGTLAFTVASATSSATPNTPQPATPTPPGGKQSGTTPPTQHATNNGGWLLALMIGLPLLLIITGLTIRRPGRQHIPGPPPNGGENGTQTAEMNVSEDGAGSTSAAGNWPAEAVESSGDPHA